MENNEISAEDLMFLVGRFSITPIWNCKHKKRHLEKKIDFSEITQVKIRAENDWFNGKDAKDNPYPDGSNYHSIWYNTWLQCNKYC